MSTETSANAVDERKLIADAKHNSEAFGELYEIYFDRIYSYVIRRVEDRQTAEDIVSDIWYKVLNKISTYQDTGKPFVAWLFAIAANAVKDHYRSKRKVVPLFKVEETLATDNDDERQMLANVNVEEAVASLTVDQKDVVLLRYVSDLSVKEVAAALNKSEVAIKALALRALKHLRQQMEGGGTHGKQRRKDTFAG